jgi:signal transduction histidine kinase
VLFIENIINLLKNRSAWSEEPDVEFVCVSAKNFRFATRTQNYLLIFIYLSLLCLFIVGCIAMVVALPFVIRSNVHILIYLPVCILVFMLAMVIKILNAHIKLCWYIKEMALGNIETIPKQTGLFVAPLNNLNNINDGVKRTMEKAIKDEKLKTELITNVSHDLKTPLTSIISYVNLLKELHLDNADADEYIEVIENKALRLKVLIDDLFEASKLSSGQMKLEKNPSDVVSLLRQTMGELSYKIEESGIEFKTDLPDYPVILNIDGQKMWRVFDNMLNNILKYSPQGSRAYIDISDETDKVVIVFKNVSSYPLDFDTDELFERFKRGDAARATEGSGLGLSIAKSIVELHGGKMRIVTDGDLFKVIIELKKL